MKKALTLYSAKNVCTQISKDMTLRLQTTVCHRNLIASLRPMNGRIWQISNKEFSQIELLFNAALADEVKSVELNIELKL
jgi:hypothetical protein